MWKEKVSTDCTHWYKVGQTTMASGQYTHQAQIVPAGMNITPAGIENILMGIEIIDVSIQIMRPYKNSQLMGCLGEAGEAATNSSRTQWI